MINLQAFSDEKAQLSLKRIEVRADGIIRIWRNNTHSKALMRLHN
jgi:hypothetical protein